MLEYWYMFPISFIFSMIAMALGIGGAAMFTPFFSLVLGLPASIAVGSGLLIEVFGFSSGIIGFARKKLINYKLGYKVLSYSIPAAVFGSIMNGFLPGWFILATLATMLIILALYIGRPGRQITRKDVSYHEDEEMERQANSLTPGSGMISGMGALFAGLTSVGLGEANDYVFLKMCKMRGAVAAGTSVFVLAITVFIASLTHMVSLLSNTSVVLEQIAFIIVFAIPGVVMGAQVGVLISQSMKDSVRERSLSAVFVAIAIVTLLALVL